MGDRARSRLELRLEEELKSTIEEAAAAVGESVSDFMRNAAAERAKRVLVDVRWTVVPTAFYDQLVTSLEEPPQDMPKLREAARGLRDVVDIR